MVKFSVLLLLIPACTFISDAEVDAKFSSSDDTTSDPDDADGDGYALSVDCDDTDPGVHPGATEVWYDGVDGDCDEADDWDQDGDGHASSAYPEAVTDLPVDDCDDHDSAIHPGAADDWYDGTDADCAGNDDYDQDGDGFARDDECDDTDATIYPSDEPEVWYNGVDEDCDGNDADQDGDGYLLVGYVGLEHVGTLPGDCVDDPGAVPDPLNDLPLLAASAIHPDADEVYYDGIDQDCAGDDDFDQDGDGSDSDAWPDGTGLYGDDCDDIDPTVNIDALDAWYDGLDSDCSGGSDYDQDGDGWDAPEGGGDDCDDTDPSVSPGAAEDCSTVFDDDCDGDTNDIGAADCLDYYADADADTYGTGSPTCQCDPDSSVSAVLAGDCDDANANANPGEVEACDTAWDDDCDGSDATALSGDPAGCDDFYEDVDGDGSGTGSAACLCAGTGTFTSATTDDCDDADESVSPGAAEITADGIDQDCDAVDTCFQDTDLDGFGSTITIDGPGLDCNVGGVADNAGDCEDGDGGVNPEGVEECATTADDDCDGATDEADALGCTLFYADADADDYGTGEGACLCAASAGYPASEDGDCDEGDAGVNPGAVEVCENGVDDDCDGGAGTCLPTSRNLSAADAKYTGEAIEDHAGISVSRAGDIDADGYDDVIIGAHGYGDAGAAYLVLGAASPVSLGLSSANARYTGEATGDQAGFSVSGAGDVDADGYDDLIIGAYSHDTAVDRDYGAAYLVRGGASPTSLSLSSATATYTGARVLDEAGTSVSEAGDVNADGYDDVIIGAPYNDDGGGAAGAVYLVLGDASPGSLDLSSANAQYSGESPDFAGYSVSGAGDVDADGFDDVIVGAWGSDYGGSHLGRAYVVLGGIAPTSASLLTADGVYQGEANEDYAGWAVAGAGDVNGDGYDDVIIGAPSNDDGGIGAGAAYLGLGGASLGWQNLSSVAAQYMGEVASDEAGYSVSGAGDVDRDGYDDLIIGAHNNDDGGSSAGAANLVLGVPAPASLSLSSADALYTGEAADDSAGISVSGAGDVDGDGFGDLLIGAQNEEEAGRDAGAAYLILGSGM